MKGRNSLEEFWIPFSGSAKNMREIRMSHRIALKKGCFSKTKIRNTSKSSPEQGLVGSSWNGFANKTDPETTSFNGAFEFWSPFCSHCLCVGPITSQNVDVCKDTFETMRNNDLRMKHLRGCQKSPSESTCLSLHPPQLVSTQIDLKTDRRPRLITDPCL